ncbi:NACHT domain-containing protein [Streptomyces chartreusis]|uniref:NACHT domain-containing protein n=1 Tax=Streptomyces chartreusis TaxID=1969 RepID=UPI0037FD706E
MLLGAGSAGRRSRRRIVRDVLVAAVGLSSVGFAVSMLAGAGGKAVDVATVGGLFIGLASLLLAVVDFFRQPDVSPDPAVLADDLALKLGEQWLEEVEARQLRDPRVLPLAWATTTRDVADTLRTGTPNARVLRMRLDGRLDGRFEEVTAQLAAGYARVPNRRLVVIGEPGSGKTVLAILLTLGLLRARENGSPVPLLLPVSSWDPVRERLDDWIVQTLAQPYYNGRTEIPRMLLAHGLLLPVLDGLDEIPESARRSAIRGINDAVGGERPIVVTCRAVEYEELIRGGAPTLRQAAVVEISPVPARDVITYLREVEWPAGVDWSPVFARLRSEPDGPLRAALSTPLMVTSARLVYQRGRGNPGELLDDDRFDCAYAVEDHLIHGLVDAVYAPDPDLPEGTGARDRWTAGQARRWLTFLAGYLHDQRERDLAWWLMSGRLMSPWAGPVTALGVGAVLVAAAVVWMVETGSITADNRSTAFVMSLCVGCAFVLFSSLIWYASEARPPGRLTWSLRGSAGRLSRGFRTGAGLTMVWVVPVLCGLTLKRVIDEPGGRGVPRAIELYIEAVTVSAALSTVVGLALATHNWLDAPPLRAVHVSAANSLAQDRRSALASASVAGLVVAVAGLPGWYAGVVSGDLLLRVLTDWTGWLGRPDMVVLAADRWTWLMGVFDTRSSLVWIAVLLPGVFFTLLVLTGRAWPRFVVARIWLATSGKLPWRLMTFLADARRRELLRQSGGVYQFRHIRLQETLAGEPTYRSEEERSRQTVRRRTVLTVGAGAAVAGAAWGLSTRQDGSLAAVAEPQRRPIAAVKFWPGSGSGVVYMLKDGSVSRWSGDPESPSSRFREGQPGLHLYWQSPMVFPAGGRFLVVGARKKVDIRDPYGRLKSTGLTLENVRGNYWFNFVSWHTERGFLACVSAGGPGAVWEASGEGNYALIPTSDFETLGTESRSGSYYGAIVGLDFLRDGSLAVVEEGGSTWRHRPPRFAEREPLLPKGRSLWPGIAEVYDDEHGLGNAVVASRCDDSFALVGPNGGELWRRNGNSWAPQPWKPGQVRTGAFHPSRPLLAVADLYGGDVHLWHTGEGAGLRPVRMLTGHNDAVLSLDFSPDGDRLATAGADGTVRIWDVTQI